MFVSTLNQIQEKKHQYERAILLAFIGYGLSLILGAMLFISWIFIIGLVPVLLGSLVVHYFSLKSLKLTKHAFLIQVLKPKIEARFKEGRYQPKQGFDSSFFTDHETLKLYDGYLSEHLIRGEIKGFPFTMAYVSIDKHVEKFKRQQVIPSFRGKVMDIVFTLPFKYDSECLHPEHPSRRKRSKKLDPLAFHEDYLVDGLELSKVKEMYAPSILEKMTELMDKYEGFAVHFKYNHMVVYIDDYTNLVDLSWRQPIDEHIYDSIDHLFKDIESLVNTVLQTKSMFA